MDRPCDTCWRYLAPGKAGPGGYSYTVGCCTSPRVANRLGVLAVSLARAWDGACGPDGLGWKAAGDEPEGRRG